jgi:hypothetical protein
MTKLPVLLPEVDTGNYGPAMQALPERMRLFVEALLTQGDDNCTRAAITAGYANEPNSNIRAAAYRVHHDERVQRAIQEESLRRATGADVMAISSLIKIAKNETTKDGDRLKAISMILNRGGLPEITRVENTHIHMDLTLEQKLNKLKAMMREDPDIRAIVAQQEPGLIMDAEFKEVLPIETGREGLEDLL